MLLDGLASELQGPTGIYLFPSTGITDVCYCTQLFCSHWCWKSELGPSRLPNDKSFIDRAISPASKSLLMLQEQHFGVVLSLEAGAAKQYPPTHEFSDKIFQRQIWKSGLEMQLHGPPLVWKLRNANTAGVQLSGSTFVVYVRHQVPRDVAQFNAYLPSTIRPKFESQDCIKPGLL